MCCRSRAKSAERDRSLSVVSDVEKEAGALTEEEARALGKVSRSTYVAYIKELGGMCFFVAVCMLFLLSLVRVLCWRRAVAGLYVTPMHVQATMIGSDVWLGIWTNASDTGDLTFYLTMYVAADCTQALPNLHTHSDGAGYWCATLCAATSSGRSHTPSSPPSRAGCLPTAS